MKNIDYKEKGLTNEEVISQREKYGKNLLVKEKHENLFKKIIKTICEPMFLLLFFAATIYFILGEYQDGLIMMVFVIGIICIETIQEIKTDKTLEALKDLSAPQIKVIRDNIETVIASEDLVPGDLMIIKEGVKIPADGRIIKCNDLCIDESSLTGESTPVWKNIEDSTEYFKKNYCYAGTLVISGSAYVSVVHTGINTEYGKIGVDIVFAKEEYSPLKKEFDKLIKICAMIALIFFFLVIIITWFNLSQYGFKERLIASILSGITLAMASIPEEFPVILTVFLSMGAWRLAKNKALIRKLSSVETLGAVSVLCVDKTGTLTMNKMSVQDIWSKEERGYLLEIMGLACETDTYDPMEKAMLEFCEDESITKAHLFSGTLIEEYPFTNELKMMGHIWSHDNEIIIATKGSAEKILDICVLEESEKKDILNQVSLMADKGLRVIGIASKKLNSEEEIPEDILDCKLDFLGLVGLADEIRESVKGDIERCIKAGIRVVMITGDNGITASSIARKIGLTNAKKTITGNELDKLSDEELKEVVKDVNIFSRVIPEHKMRIVNALKALDEVVAMTGDGVNDASALKYADIGIAMGHRGSEVSREAADLILLDDNFSTIPRTIKDGRKIYDNIKKAIGYVLAIHIPIILLSVIAPLLKILPEDLFLLPLHVMMLELIIDPTCSIVLERQPEEHGIMTRKPRDSKTSIINLNMVLKSILQGLMIFIASFGTYYYILNTNGAMLARTMGFTILIFSSIFLVLTNSSESESFTKTVSYLIKDKLVCIIFGIMLIGIMTIIYTPLNQIVKFTDLSLFEFVSAILIAFVSVMWYEIVKRFKNKTT